MDLFTSSNGDYDIQKSHINDKGEFVITAGLTNNGILGKSDVKAKIFDKNTITVDMFGNPFFRNFKYKMVTHARVFSLKPLFELTENQGLFIASSLYYLNKLYGYENMCSWEKIKNNSVKLPIKNKKIDFEFMENFVSELESQYVTELETYLNVTGLKDYELTEEEKNVLNNYNNIEYEDFEIEDIFNIFTGRDIIIGKTKDGVIPLISNQNTNNGIVNKIEQLNNRRIFDFNKTISLADRGLFYATTQNENFHIGTRVKALVFKDNEKSIKERLFFVTSINKLQILFTDYSKNATNKLQKLKIKLPVKNNKIDYYTINMLISAIQKLIIKDVVKYADMKIKTTKKVINN